MADARLQLIIDAKDRTARGLGSVGDRLDRINVKLKAMRGPLLLAGAAIVGLGVFAVKAASDLEEAINKAQVAFGSATDTVIDFAETSAEQFALSRRAAFEYAGTLGLILNASGLTKQASADMSVSLVKLAADLSSINNVSIEEALIAIRSGLVGEVEPLRKFGVLLSQAALETKALELGLVNQGEALDEASKVQARYSLIMEQTIPIQGDMQNTMDSTANSAKQMAAFMEDAAASIGVILQPVVTDLIQSMTALLKGLENLGPTGQRFIVMGALIAVSLIAIGLIIPPLIASVGALVAVFAFLTVGVLGPLLAAFGFMAIALLLIIKQWDDFKVGLEFILQSVADGFEAFVNIFIKGFNLMIDQINRVSGIIGVKIAEIEEVVFDIGPAFDSVARKIESFGSGAAEKLKGLSDQIGLTGVDAIDLGDSIAAGADTAVAGLDSIIGKTREVSDAFIKTLDSTALANKINTTADLIADKMGDTRQAILELFQGIEGDELLAALREELFGTFEDLEEVGFNAFASIAESIGLVQDRAEELERALAARAAQGNNAFITAPGVLAPPGEFQPGARSGRFSGTGELLSDEARARFDRILSGQATDEDRAAFGAQTGPRTNAEGNLVVVMDGVVTGEIIDNTNGAALRSEESTRSS